MQIRALQRPDALALATLHSEGFDSPWPADAFARLLTLPSTLGWGLDREGDYPGGLQGLLLIQRIDDTAEVLSFQIAHAWQGQGWGGRLLRHALGQLIAEGVTQIYLEVGASQTCAQSLYSAVGFTAIGRRKNYYKKLQGREDAVVMTLGPIGS